MAAGRGWGGWLSVCLPICCSAGEGLLLGLAHSRSNLPPFCALNFGAIFHKLLPFSQQGFKILEQALGCWAKTWLGKSARPSLWGRCFLESPLDTIS